jgi:hypothetical protein
MLPEKYSVVWELIQQWWGKSIIALKMSRRWERWLLSRYIRKWLLRTQTRSPCTILKVNEYRLPSSLELPNQDLAIGEIIPRLTVRFVIAWHYLRYCTGCCLELVGAVYINHSPFFNFQFILEFKVETLRKYQICEVIWLLRWEPRFKRGRGDDTKALE